MFSATFPAGGAALRNLVELIKDDKRIPAGFLSFTSDGICLSSMDASQIAFVDLKILPNAADSFSCANEYKLGIDFAVMSKIMSTSTEGTLTITYSDDNPDFLLFVFKYNKRTSRFKMKLKDEDELGGSIDIPENLPHKCTQKVDSAEFQKCLKNIQTFTEDVTLTRTLEKLIFTANGETAEFIDEFSLPSIDLDEDVTAMFSVKYLLWFSTAAALNSEFTLAFDDVHPLLMEYENELARYRFYLAGKYE